MARILVIDDEQVIREMLLDALGDEGFEVVGAVDGDDALKKAAVGDFDLFITDILMPDKEGIETILELRKSFGNTKIIAMSGGGRIGPGCYLDTAKQLGAAVTFTKPFSIKDMVTAVKDLLR